MTAEQFAKEFIHDLFFDDDTQTEKTFDEPIQVSFNENVYQDDPNLKVLKSELNKVGLDINESNNKKYKIWIVSKIEE